MSLHPSLLHSIEVEIDAELVRSLLQSQHPDLAKLPIHSPSAGWDNTMFRLGDRLAVRLPHRQLGAKLIAKEQQWLPILAPQLTLPVPQPLRIGTPSDQYRWRWSIVPWIEGVTADRDSLQPGEGVRLAEFLRSLHTPAPNNAPKNPFRGIPLIERAKSVNPFIDRVAAATELITPTIQQIWARSLTAPITTQSRWLHGDLHPHNILTTNGVLTGVIDWGDLTAGDVATDLAAIWMLLESSSERTAAVTAYGMDEATCWRSQGWAITFATILLATGLVNNPAQAEIGHHTLRRLEADNLKVDNPTGESTINR